MICFIRSPEGPIKIGTTVRLSERLKQLAVEHGPGLEVLAVVDGSFQAERGLHGRFAHLRKVGEWFEPGDDLIGFIVAEGRPWTEADDAPGFVDVRLRVDSDLHQRIQDAADQESNSVAAFIRTAVVEKLKRIEREGK